MSKVLMISLGSIGRRHLVNTRELLPDAEIAVYRTHFYTENVLPEAADKLFFEISDALAFKPDAVIISSPASEHVKHALEFINNGANVFIEKPLAMTHQEVDAVITASRDTDRFAMVGYVLRFQPILHFIRDLLHSGDLGEIRTANVQVGQYLPDWRPESDYRKGVSAQKKLGGGALLELSHELDYSTWLFGMPDQVLCSSGKVSDLDIDVEDSACVIMEYGHTELARRVVVQVDFLQRVANMAIQVVGSEATLYADLVRERAYIASPGQDEVQSLDVPKMAEGNEMYLRQFDFFFARSFDDYQPRFDETRKFADYVSVEHAAGVLKLVDLAKESNSKGMRIRYQD
ncbi:MAG: Gfo/Idh/MocA family oxidoreductase [Gammaproteobacteria bacterium]|nr:Gfo/Idh/MocA family oxidoreductase [Gammaproteobacteria bacterium]